MNVRRQYAKDEQTWEKNHQECIKINVIICGLMQIKMALFSFRRTTFIVNFDKKVIIDVCGIFFKCVILVEITVE